MQAKYPGTAQIWLSERAAGVMRLARERFASFIEDALDLVALVEREQLRESLAAKLEAHMFHDDQGDEVEIAYRRGWNDRAQSIVRELRGES